MLILQFETQESMRHKNYNYALNNKNMKNGITELRLEDILPEHKFGSTVCLIVKNFISIIYLNFQTTYILEK